MQTRASRLAALLAATTALLLGVAVSGCTGDQALARDQARTAPAAAIDPVSSSGWTADMARFAAEDARKPPPAHPVVFTGSSSVRMWSSLAQDFPDLPVLNRGFGGSQMRDLFHYAEPVAIRYQPRQIVLYSGDNDINAGRSPEQVLHDFNAVVARIRRDLPQVPILVLSIKPSPSRIDELPRQQEANKRMAEAASQTPGMTFVDVATPMLDNHGQPRAELFREDRLHMTPAGYAVWRQVVGPHLLH